MSENPVYPDPMSRAESDKPHIYTVSPGHNLLSVLADHLLYEETFGTHVLDAALDLSDVTLLLPTKRAVRSMGETFLARSAGKACILPQMRALGDVEEAELALNEFSHFSVDELSLPATTPPLERQLRLANLISKTYPETFVRAGQEAPKMNPSAALSVARELLALLDSAEIERVSLSHLSKIVADRFAENWQQTLEFLKVITDLYPKEIADAGMMEPMAKRNELMALYCTHLKSGGAKGRIIAAGSTGSTPATSDLLREIASLPLGAVILPGLDPFLDEETWDNISDEHPQYGMKKFISSVGIKRGDVTELVPRGGGIKIGRARLMSEVMRPAEDTDKWSETLSSFKTQEIERALKNVEVISAPTLRDEALTIALHLRSVLETPGKTAALVTPDRGLAKRVTSEMKRWGVEINDSAGEKLSRGRKARALLAIADTLGEEQSPVSLLSLLRHPDICAGLHKSDLNQKTNMLETTLLRGPRPARGFGGLRLAIEHLKNDEHAAKKTTTIHAITELLDALEAAFAPLLALEEKGPFDEMLTALLQVFEHLMAIETGHPASPLWAGDEGEALALLFSDLFAAAEHCPSLSKQDLKPYLQTLMDERISRAPHTAHPRLYILGLLEARLLSFDKIILGGMNETVWPRAGSIDPWLNRPMRADLELPSPERRIGLSAHDFVQNFCAQEVVVTRAEKVDGVPTVPSRWLLRLKAVMEAVGSPELISKGESWLSWASGMDRAESVTPAPPPRPTPPVVARPRKLSVTQIETWQRDPYAIYARHILGLRPLQDIDADPSYAEKGTLIHKVMERFTLETTKRGGVPTLECLQEIAAEEFAKWEDRPSVTAFWLPRFERIAVWYVPEEIKLRKGAKTHHVEVFGQAEVDTKGKPFTLRGIADRIDVLQDGTLRILDYKTGAVPGKKEVGAFASQMPLEAYMALQGGFEGIEAAHVSHLSFVKLTGTRPAGEFITAGETGGEDAVEAITSLAQKTMTGLKTLIEKFDQEDMPYLSRINPKHEEMELDYDHLSRYREWAVLQSWEDRSK